MMKKTGMSARAGVSIAVVAVATLIGGVGLGAVAAASNPVEAAPVGLSAEQGVLTTPKPAPTYPQNANGQTYGSAAEATSPDNEPDLISVITTNNLLPADAAKLTATEIAAVDTGRGEVGYVRKTELNDANGSNIKSPDEAAEWMRDGARKDHAVTVYEKDGVTPIGQFIVYGLESQDLPPER